MSETVLVEKRDHVTYLKINRPKVLNAVDADTMILLRQKIEACETDGTRVIVIGGTEGAFSTGADIKSALASKATPDMALDVLTKAYAPTIKALRGSSWPVIAAIDGPAAGIGLDLGLACDIRVASSRAELTAAFIRVGLVPDGGGTWTMPRFVGMAKAMELALTGASLSADESLELGLVNHVWDEAEFDNHVWKFAGKIARQAPLALTRTKKAMLAGQNSTFDEAMALEAKFQREIFASEDGFEGFKAFLEKRAPVWKGR